MEESKLLSIPVWRAAQMAAAAAGGRRDCGRGGRRARLHVGLVRRGALPQMAHRAAAAADLIACRRP